MHKTCCRTHAPRRAWMAVLISLLFFPFGQLYNGRMARGMALLVGWHAAWLVLIALGALESLSGLAAVAVFFTVFYIAAAIEAGIDARRIGQAKPKSYQNLKGYAMLVALVVCVTLVSDNIQGTMHNLRAFKVPSISMLPTLQVGDHILVKKHQPFQRGDVVVFKAQKENTYYVKRVVAQGGDTVQVQNGILSLNSCPIEERYAAISTSGGGQDYGPEIVPEGMVFVLGDNRSQSKDSRVFGPVPTKDVVGPALYVYWSWDSEKTRLRLSRMGQQVK